MPITRPTRAVATVALAGLLLAGCAGTAQQAAEQSGLAPAARVDAAVSSVLDTERLTVAVGLDLDDATRSALVALATEDGELSAAAAERLLDTRLVTTVVADDGLLSELPLSFDPATVPAVSTSVALETDGENLVEVRQVGTDLYARVDLPGLEAALGQEGLVDELTAGTAGMEGAPDELVTAVDTLTAGGWVGLDSADLVAQLTELGLPAAGATPSTDTSRATAAVESFLSDAATVLRKEVVVSQTGDDSYDVTTPLDKVLTSLTPSLTTLVGELVSAGGVPGTGAEPGGPEADALLQEMTTDVQGSLEDLQDELAGRTATVQVGLDGDRLASVRFDLVQLVGQTTREDMVADGVSSLPVLATFSTAGEVTAPEGATAVDVAGLVEGWFGLAAPPAGSVPEEALEPGADPLAGMTADDLGMTEEEFAAFREEMGLAPTP